MIKKCVLIYPSSGSTVVNKTFQTFQTFQTPQNLHTSYFWILTIINPVQHKLLTTFSVDVLLIFEVVLVELVLVIVV